MFERNNDLERKQLAPGVCITTLDASKFNRCCITLHLRFPAKRESATDARCWPLCWNAATRPAPI